MTLENLINNSIDSILKTPDVFECIDCDEVAETVRYLIKKDIDETVWHLVCKRREEIENTIENAINNGYITLDD